MPMLNSFRTIRMNFRSCNSDIQFKNLSPKEQLITLFDSSQDDIADKQFTLSRLHERWNKLLIDEQPFKWFLKERSHEKKKYECAWLWYSDSKNIDRYSLPAPPQFASLDELLSFLDLPYLKTDEKLYHLEQIKKKYKAMQVQANRKGKTQTNISLSDRARQQLDSLSKKEGMSKTELIELLLQNATENGVLGK